MEIDNLARTALIEELKRVSQSASFNQWAGFEVLSAEPGAVEISLPWNENLGQYSQYLHAALIAGLIDTACGFAAYTLSGAVLTSQFSVRCLAPAQGERFIVRGKVIKAGKRQIFTCAELFAHSRTKPELLCALGEAVLVPV